MGLKKIFALWLALGILVFAGCKQDSNDDVSVIGTWVSSYGENYTITSSTFDNGYYAGNNLKVKYVSDDSGYIYFKYTKAMNSDYSYSETAPDVGKWYCVSFKSLTNNTVSLSGAYKASSSGGKTSTETLEEAIAEFTVENGYFVSYSECTRK